MEKYLESGCVKTRLALLWMNTSTEPLAALYSLIPFILRSELQANVFQIALFTMLSPVSSLFSFYWGSYLSYRKNRVVSNLIGSWVLARLPFLFFPWMSHFWVFLIASIIYQLFSRATTPALMEVLNQNLPKKTREHVFSLYYAISVVEGIVLGLILLKVFKINESNWRLAFLLSSLISLTSVFFQCRIRMPKAQVLEEPLPKNPLISPLKESFRLLSTRPDFALFQWAFMMGGLSLMIIAPLRSIFLVDNTSTSLSDLAVARCIFLGVGMAGSSFFWKRHLEKFGLERAMVWILIGFAIYPCLLFLTCYHVFWLYLAHFIYGVAQAGSHLIWHLSGTIFAKGESSSPFTTVNLLMIGIRGAVGPFLGVGLSLLLGSTPVLILGSILALGGAFYVLQKSRQGAFVRNSADF